MKIIKVLIACAGFTLIGFKIGYETWGNNSVPYLSAYITGVVVLLAIINMLIKNDKPADNKPIS